MRLFFCNIIFPTDSYNFYYIFISLRRDGKNPFFLQERIGENGNNFHAIKFRTMVPNAEKVLEEALKKMKFKE